MLQIGIDAGVNTGVAVAVDGVLQSVQSMTITQAMQLVFAVLHQSPTLYIEDARKRTWFGGMDAKQAKHGAGVREGVGSVKRDCQIWEDFCKEQGIEFVLVHPAANKTKLDAKDFGRITKWEGRTNEHGRDAAMLVFGRQTRRRTVV